jgi:hypothetical protein
MNMKWLKVAVGTLAGCGIGYFIAKRRTDDLEVQRDNLAYENIRLEQKCADMARVNDNLREANRWITEVALKEAIVEDHGDMMDDVEAWAEESKQIVDEMSDEECEATLAYMHDEKHD